MEGILLILIIFGIIGGLVMLAIKGFKFALDENHGCILRVIVFIIACSIVLSLFGIS